MRCMKTVQAGFDKYEDRIMVVVVGRTLLPGVVYVYMSIYVTQKGRQSRLKTDYVCTDESWIT